MCLRLTDRFPIVIRNCTQCLLSSTLIHCLRDIHFVESPFIFETSKNWNSRPTEKENQYTMKCLPICTNMWEKLLSLEVDLVPSTGAVSTTRGMIASENVVSENVVAFFQFIQKEESNRTGIFISLGNLEKNIFKAHIHCFLCVARGKMICWKWF